jgi:polar amino acid transport system permease protein
VNCQFKFEVVFAAWPLLLKSTWITIQRALVATVLGLMCAGERIVMLSSHQSH